MCLLPSRPGAPRPPIRPAPRHAAPQFEVFTRQVRHPSGFHMAFTDPAKDIDVSSSIHHEALLERGFTWAWCAPLAQLYAVYALSRAVHAVASRAVAC